jgi:hypothetical protein
LTFSVAGSGTWADVFWKRGVALLPNSEDMAGSVAGGLLDSVVFAGVENRLVVDGGILVNPEKAVAGVATAAPIWVGSDVDVDVSTLADEGVFLSLTCPNRPELLDCVGGGTPNKLDVLVAVGVAEDVPKDAMDDALGGSKLNAGAAVVVVRPDAVADEGVDEKREPKGFELAGAALSSEAFDGETWFEVSKVNLGGSLLGEAVWPNRLGAEAVLAGCPNRPVGGCEEGDCVSADTGADVAGC